MPSHATVLFGHFIVIAAACAGLFVLVQGLRTGRIHNRGGVCLRAEKPFCYWASVARIALIVGASTYLAIWFPPAG